MHQEPVPGSPNIWEFDRDDDLVDIFYDKPIPGHPPHPGPPHPGRPHPGPHHKKTFYEDTIEQSSSRFSYVPVAASQTLRRLYPNHSLVMSQSNGILSLPGLSAEPLEGNPLVTNEWFVSLPRRYGIPGVLIEQIEYGAFKLEWNGFEFLLFVVTFPQGFGMNKQQFILHEGSEEPGRLLLLSAGAWSEQLHDEIWVFDQGYWSKNHALWAEVQKANWDDVILKDAFKKALQKDVYGFFKSEQVYKDLGIAWKRGLIMYGPPGNGKTISLKAIMKTCAEQGISPLYVKSFRSWMGEEAAMTMIFDKARDLSPSVIILEDIDSLINDQNRSFFLNQVDGIEGNDGLLLIGTTNHFDRLDPGLSTRPSRFDRKYKFDDPDVEERTLYVQYWQKKLKNNSSVDFPDSLVKEIAESTDQFSFAYLKEAFVSSLVTLAGWDSGDKPSFASLIKQEIKTLRKQLDKSIGYDNIQKNLASTTAASKDLPAPPQEPETKLDRDIRKMLDTLSEAAPFSEPPSRRLFTDFDPRRTQPRPSEEEIRKNRNIQALIDALSDHLETSDVSSFRRYETVSSYGSGRRSYGNPQPDFESGESSGTNYRALLDRLGSERDRDMRLFDLQQTSARTRPTKRAGPMYSQQHHGMHGFGVGHYGGPYTDRTAQWEGYRAAPRAPQTSKPAESSDPSSSPNLD